MRSKILPLLMLLSLVSITTLSAQVTTGTLYGSILDESGNPLVAATVVAIHTPSGTQYGTTTRDDGRYTLPNLRVGGPYTVQTSFVGYADQKIEGLYITIGEKVLADFTTLSEGTTLDEVVVAADRNAILNSERTGASTNISTEQLQKLPTISRSASDYTRLTPSSDGNSFGGRNDQYNNFSLDGSIFNNPFGLDAATPGGQTSSQPVSLDAIEQINVAIAPYDVTLAGFTGASVNAVTKSGTNTLAGTAYGFFRNQDLTGSKVGDLKIDQPDLTESTYGLSLGGPLVKDKLFFFVNAEVNRREDLGSNFVASRPGLTGENVSRVEAADLDAVSEAFASIGYQTGPYEGYIHETNSNKGLAKLDWAINKNNTLTATYNFLNADKDKPAHPSAIGRRGPDATTLQFYNSGYRINNVIHSGIVELRSLFGNSAANKMQVGYTTYKDSRDPFSAPFPVVNINKDGIRYIVAGHEPFSVSNRLSQDVIQFTDNLTLYKGDHTLTFGTNIEYFAFDNSFNLGAYDGGDSNPGGTFGGGFESVQAFLDTIAAGVFVDDAQFAQDLFNANGGADGELGAGWALAETNVGQFALYAQDEWRPNNKLTLTAGIRMDMPLYFDTPTKLQENIDRNCCYAPDITWFNEDGEPVNFDHTVLPDNTPLFSPRIGFNYDVKGNKTAQLRGGTGLFSGRLPFVWLGNQVANPNWFFYNYTANDFKFPQVWRTNLGYDQKIGEGWTLTTDLIYTKDLNAALVRNYSLNTPTETLKGAGDNRLIYTDADRAIFNGLGFPLPLVGSGFVFTNTDQGYIFNASAQVQKTFKSGLHLMLGYSFIDAQDASSIEAEISSDAFERNPVVGNVNRPELSRSLYGNRHRFIGSAYKTFTYGSMATTVSTFFSLANAGTTGSDFTADYRFSYTYSGDANGDGSAINDLLYIPTDSELDQQNWTSAEQREAFRRYIQQDEYLTDNRGDYVEKYGIVAPWFGDWDIRILQDFNLKNTNKLQLSIDVVNFGNLINSSWNVKELPVNTQPVGILVTDGVPTYSFETSLTDTYRNDTSLLSRWQMQLGLRFIF